MLRFRLLGSGSGGNATLIEAAGSRILLDAGLGPRELAERLQSAGIEPSSLRAIVLSHEHGDHAKGSVSFSRKWGVPLGGSRGTYAALGLGACRIPAYEVIEAAAPLRLGALSVRAIPVPHDAAEPVAFVVAADGASLGHATDLGQWSRALVEAFRGCDALLVESNYDPELLRRGPYPWSLKERILGPRGHLSNGDVARYLASGLGDACRSLVLAHLSQNNNHPELVQMSADAALRARGRGSVAVTIAAPEGTGWIAVAGEAQARGAEAQLKLKLF